MKAAEEMTREQKEVKLRMILQDYHRRNDYELQQAVNDIMALDPSPSSATAEEINKRLAESLGEPDNSIEDHSYEIRPLTVEGRREWWIFHNGVGSGEPLAQWIKDFAALQSKPQPTAEGAEEIAQCCPVCGGNGLVPNGFYNQTSGQWTSCSTLPGTCRTCNGTGVILPSYLHAQKIADKMASERLREELGKFIKWYNSGYEQARKPHLIVKEYLKSR